MVLVKKVILIITLSIHGCSLFEKDETLLAEHKKGNGEKIKIYHIGVGATSKDVIHVRKSSSKTPIWVNDKYNFLESSKLINDSILQLILSDTGYHNLNNKLDTIDVNVK